MIQQAARRVCFIQLFYDTGNGFNENEMIKITAEAGDERIIFISVSIFVFPDGLCYASKGSLLMK